MKNAFQMADSLHFVPEYYDPQMGPLSRVKIIFPPDMPAEAKDSCRLRMIGFGLTPMKDQHLNKLICLNNGEFREADYLNPAPERFIDWEEWLYRAFPGIQLEHYYCSPKSLVFLRRPSEGGILLEDEKDRVLALAEAYELRVEHTLSAGFVTLHVPPEEHIDIHDPLWKKSLNFLLMRGVHVQLIYRGEQTDQVFTHYSCPLGLPYHA